MYDGIDPFHDLSLSLSLSPCLSLFLSSLLSHFLSFSFAFSLALSVSFSLSLSVALFRFLFPILSYTLSRSLWLPFDLFRNFSLPLSDSRLQSPTVSLRLSTVPRKHTHARYYKRNPTFSGVSRVGIRGVTSHTLKWLVKVGASNGVITVV